MPRSYTKRTKEKRRELALRVVDLRLRGGTWVDISRTLNIPESTVRALNHAARRYVDGDFRNLTARLVGQEFFLAAQPRILQFWHIANAPTTPPSTRVRALAEVRREYEAMVRTAQDLGLVHREPQRVQVERGEFSGLSDSDLESLAQTEARAIIQGASGAAITDSATVV